MSQPTLALRVARFLSERDHIASVRLARCTAQLAATVADAQCMTICVIPAFRAASSLLQVVSDVLPNVDHVIVVDDFCPQECGLDVGSAFAGDPRVEVLRHQANRGVGGAMKTGIRRALQLNADIIVKIDADGQMDPAHIPELVRILKDHPRVALVKGNRFFDGSIARVMPGLRLLGNSALTLLVRMSSGYWNSIDPTNGYFAIKADRIRRMNFDDISDRYFFEISVLCSLGLRRTEIGELDMPARYGAERSSLSIGRVLASFPQQLGARLVKRLGWQYVISDMNVGSLFLIVGSLLMLLAIGLGATWWIEALRSGIPRTPGTIGLVFVPLFMGFQLLLNAVLYDVQSAPRVLKFQNAKSLGEFELANLDLSTSTAALERLPRT